MSIIVLSFQKNWHNFLSGMVLIFFYTNFCNTFSFILSAFRLCFPLFKRLTHWCLKQIKRLAEALMNSLFLFLVLVLIAMPFTSDKWRHIGATAVQTPRACLLILPTLYKVNQVLLAVPTSTRCLHKLRYPFALHVSGGGLDIALLKVLWHSNCTCPSLVPYDKITHPLFQAMCVYPRCHYFSLGDAEELTSILGGVRVVAGGVDGGGMWWGQ